jgi:hypothetical protein
VLDRRQGRLAAVAIAAYVDTIESVEREKLKFVGGDGGALEHDASELLLGALHIGRTIGWEKPETVRARKMVVRLRERATELRAGVAALWFGELDLDFGVSDPAEVATGIEQVIAAPANVDVHILASLWRLAARGYHLSKRADDTHRCQTAAAEAMAAEAERLFAAHGRRQGSAMQASHMMSNAIAQLHGVPDAKKRRTELRHRLVDIQTRVPEDMSVFALPWDIKGVEAKVKEALGEGPLLDQLFIFAAVANSPDPASLISEAKNSMQQHPLASLIPAVHYDKEGKAVHRSASAGSLGVGLCS